MKRFYYGLLASFFSFLVVVAEIIIKPNCVGQYYQPELPKSLRK